MNQNIILLIIAVLTIVCTFLGGFFALKYKDKLHSILGFSAGTVLGVALFDLLPESIELTKSSHSIELVTLFIALGFAVYLIIDRYFSLHFHADSEDNHLEKKGHLGAATLSLHSFLDGLAIGLAFKVSTAIGWVVAAAVLTHDFSDGINTVSIIFKNTANRKIAIRWLIADAIAPAVGLATAYLFTVSEPVLGLILAIFTGFFLEIGASDLIPESHHHHPKFLTTLMTILGLTVIFLAIHFAK